MTEYEIIMFKGDAIVEGSRRIISDEALIKNLESYASMKGYTFSCTKREKEN